MATPRTGSDPRFLDVRVPRPRLRAAGGAAAPEVVTLDYVHFTVWLRPDRRLAAATAVDVDGTALVDVERARDRWLLDERVPTGAQAGPDLYADNALDRGHLVRRRDPCWGDPATAAAANADTFRYPNAAPQVDAFNQSAELWLGLEDHVLGHADATRRRLVVLTGPVLADDDPPYRGVLLPRAFWKVVAWSADGALACTAFLLDQADLLAGVLVRGLAPSAVEAPELGAFRTFQVTVAEVEERAGLDLAELVTADRLAARVSSQARPRRELTSAADVVLG